MRSDSTAHQIVARHRLPARIRVPVGASTRNLVASGYRADDSLPSTTITAAAQILSHRKIDRTIKRPQVEQWQTDAWTLYDEIGEFRFIGDRQARAVSQVRLFVGKSEGADATPTPTDDPLGVELQEVLFGSRAATEQFLKRCAQQLIYNGDSIIHPKQDGERIATFARSVQELGGRPGDWTFDDGVSGPEKVGDDPVIRCWMPHPERYGKATAPARAVLPVARELRGLTQFVSAQVDSRLAGAGILLVPQEIESMWAQVRERDGDDPMTFAEELTEYLLTPIQDRDSAAAVVPFLVSLPADMIEKVRHLTFASPLDEHAAKLRDESIRRIGLGMDSDPSILLGQGSGNHWSAWAVDTNEVRYGVEPIAAVICHALTVGLVRPLLETRGVTDAHRWQVWYDPSGLVVRDDRSKDAQALWDKELVSAETVRTENGFADSDAPDVNEIEQRRLWELAKMRPDLLEAILPKVGINLVLPDSIPPQEVPDAVDAPESGVAEEAPDGPPVMGQTPATEDPTPEPEPVDVVSVAMGESPMPEGAVDEAGQPIDPKDMKALFDALGAAVRAGVEPDDAAARLGLSGIRFTGATPVSLRQPVDEANKLEEK